MSTPEHPYALLVALLAIAVAFCLAPLSLAWLWSVLVAPPKPGPEKSASYECGLESKGDAWISFRSEYYRYALIFLVFDVEAVFFLPFAVAFTGLPVGAWVAMLIFLLLLVEGWLWAWRKGVLEWSPRGRI